MVNRVKAVLFRKSTSALLVLAATAIASGAMIVSASTTISQIGSDIDGEAAGDYSGFSVSLSSDGTAVAIGAHLNDGNGADSGHVRVYEWNENAWQQKGADINGEAEGDRSGRSVSLSSDGTRVAVGADINSETGVDAGHVRVYSITTSTPTTTTTAPLTTEAPTTTTVVLPATGLSNGAAPQVLLVLGVGGLLVLFTRHRPSVRD